MCGGPRPHERLLHRKKGGQHSAQGAVWPLSGLRFWLENDLQPDAGLGQGQGQAREGLGSQVPGRTEGT